MYTPHRKDYLVYCLGQFRRGNLEGSTCMIFDNQAHIVLGAFFMAAHTIYSLSSPLNIYHPERFNPNQL
jgi:hypothetical protein